MFSIEDIKSLKECSELQLELQLLIKGSLEEIKDFVYTTR